MASENISIRKDAYDFLNSMKSEGESFSDVILRIKSGKNGTVKDLLDFSGSLEDEEFDWETREQKIRSLRKSWNSKLEKLRSKKEVKHDRSGY